MSRKFAWAPVLLGLALLVTSPLLAGSATTTILTVTDNGNETYTVSLSSVVGITTSDHMGARITNSSGPGGVWTVTEVRPSLHASANTLLLTDNLYEERGAGTPFGAPIAGSAWYGTPTTAVALSRVPHTAVAWDGALRRNVFQSAASINSRINADGTTALTANWDAGGYEIRSLTFESDATTGTAPFTVASTTKVTNLNVDSLDGSDSTSFQPVDAMLTSLAAVNTNTNGSLLSTSSGEDVVNIPPGTVDYPLVANGAATPPTYKVLPVAGGGTGSATAANARTALGLAIGTNVQAYDAQLASVANVTSQEKGQLLAFTGQNLINVGKGTDGDVLKADSGSPGGVTWGAEGALDAMLTSLAAVNTNTNGSLLSTSAGEDVVNIPPGATNLPLVSNGAGVPPTYKVVPIEGGGTNATNVTDARSNLGLIIGSGIQQWDSALQGIANITTMVRGSVLVWADPGYGPPINMTPQRAFTSSRVRTGGSCAGNITAGRNWGALAGASGVDADNTIAEAGDYSAQGQAMSLVSGTGTTASAYYSSGSQPVAGGAASPSMSATFRFLTDLTDFQFQAGFCATPSDQTYCVALRYDEDENSGLFRWVTDGSGATATYTSAGVAPAADVFYRVEIYTPDGGTTWNTALFNSETGQLLDSQALSSDVPAATQPLYITVGLTKTSTATVKNLYVNNVLFAESHP